MGGLVIDLGPGGGESGGHIVAQGTPEEIANTPKSLTGQYLKPLLILKLTLWVSGKRRRIKAPT